MNLGLSGRLTKATLRSPLTPLFLLAALAVGLIAILTIPREEDPQIHVPMVDVMVSTNGLHAADAAELVTKPLETILTAIPGVEHIYSQTQDDQVMVTARFVVGTNEDDAVLRVNNKIGNNLDRIPIGIPRPLVVGRGINDVAVMVLTLSPKPDAANRWTQADLTQLAQKLQTELVKIPDMGITYIAGDDPEEIRVEPDPEKLSLFGVTLQQLVAKVRDANRSFVAGHVRDAGVERSVAAGQTLLGVPDIGLLLIGTRDGRPVYVRDVARVVVGTSPVDARVWNITRDKSGTWHRAPAVSLALAKRPGANAVVMSAAVRERLKTLEGTLVPSDVSVNITRDYGTTANDKANELLFHLALATVSIVVLIAFAIGWREGVVTLVVIPTTILMTMFASKTMGYTINRVSLFALIFSIGILVDDAIVVVENIARHWAMGDKRGRAQAAIEAVAEVGNPTVVATLTVVAALLPMLFVSGLMGPYMAPIPANASAAMMISFVVAMVIAPWMMLKLAPKTPLHGHAGRHDKGWFGRVYRFVATPLVASRKRAWTFLLLVGGATLVACSAFYFEAVTVKLLPFDNKSELTVLVDLPEGSSLETTEQALFAADRVARALPEVTEMQAYAGTAQPFDFNGLVRHYYLRQSPELGELHVQLQPKEQRDRSSHAIALDLRHRLDAELKLPAGSVIKVVEVPPGPPVLATLLAEVYGPDEATRLATAQELKKIFRSVPFIVDVDDSFGHPRPRLRISIDQDRLEYFGVEQSDVYDTIQALFGGLPVGYSYRGEDRYPLDIVVGLPKRDQSWTEQLASTPVPANTLPGARGVVELGEVVQAKNEMGSRVLFRRDGHFADMVMAELAGRFEAPIYGMLAVDKAVEAHDWGKLPRPTVSLRGQPDDESKPSILWDGEWEITYVTFRDMGGAFMVALVGIYVLVVAQFGSFKLPLLVLVPVPLTLIGIVFGHWLFGAPFTATSMIGFIALAGIIVRNSILLIDFIRHTPQAGMTLRQVVLEAGAIRFKPILLTALSAMIGAATILSDPIFQGLAISLLFGLASSTLLTVLVIPAIYVVLRDPERVLVQQTVEA
ncbi:efflux RND transporter permease subunit [Rhodopila globiformis]|uniref:Multidrug transporter AcrB n=1 Tax=Rhodopila globiformis TaxID=1071 RepID=A0A2S6MZE7_RHOGL|nr:efflux RND transporter permease subunit [Rhodopila globiformis]PPQ27729.1 multidrug transporter AcrB [Rhodopila globiformis]